jgi:signal transduction histidine kinase
VREAVVRFTVSSAVLLAVLIVATVFLASRIATDEALRDARMRGSAIGNLIAAPLVNSDVRAHVPGAGSQLDRVLRNRMSDGSVTHMKVWTRQGEVIWSDEEALVGRHFPLPDDVKALFGTRQTISEVSDLSKEENVEEREEGELLEVYSGTADADKVPMVFEAYFSGDTMRRDEKAIIGGFLPIVIAALLLFQVSVLPMALSLARRVERGLAERSSWMRHALLASDLERRRIAQDLHDGVIQDLAGLCYALPTLETHFGDDPGADAARQTSQRATQILSRDVAALRAMITDIYPPNLEGPGFKTAVQDLARSAGERGVQVDVEMTNDLALPVDTARLAYRVIREGLRNVAKHAEASAATVRIREEFDRIVVSVSDNGIGVPDGPVTEGHLGLRLLEDTVRDLDGEMNLQAVATGGAVLTASFPLRLTQS